MMPLGISCPPREVDDMAEWIHREHGKGEIDRAGEFLALWWRRLPKEADDISMLSKTWIVAQNWRTSHAYPLNSFQVNLRARARRVEDGALVAQRLKRISSVLNKLAREPKMKLSQMQDLGGCRAILSDVNAVDKLFGMYRGGDDLLFESESNLKCYDYLREPKSDGYRGIHVVGRFAARSEAREDWNGHRIEIQLRSRLQHAFATAVETVTTFTREPLKFGGGPDTWKRFFSLMGSALAVREGTPLVPGTPVNESELTKELRETAKELKVRHRLRGWSNALKSLPRRNIKGFKWLLLVLDVEANTIKVTGYADRQKAATAVAELEKRKANNLDAVLVWVRSARDLRKAYPNYYADATEFLRALDKALNV